MKLIDRTFLKFIIVGIINTIFGSVIMFFMYNVLNINYWISSMTNYISGSILSFFLNKYYTFKVKEWSLLLVITYILNIIICYLIAYGAAKPLMNYIFGSSPIRVRENLALLTGLVLFSGLNYLGQRLFVFGKFVQNS